MPDTAQPQARAPEASHHPVTCAGTACPCYQEGLGNQVHQVPPGSVVVLRGNHDLPLEVVAGELARAAGHHQFVVVDLPAGTSLDVVHDPQAVADLLGLARPSCDCAPSAHTMDGSPPAPHPNPHLPPLLGPDGCPCGEPEGATVHQVPVTDLVERLDASLAAARDYLATHPPDPAANQAGPDGRCTTPGCWCQVGGSHAPPPAGLLHPDPDDEAASDPWRDAPGLSDADR